MYSHHIVKALALFGLLALSPASAQQRPLGLGSNAELNAALEHGVDREALTRSFRTLSAASYIDLRRAQAAVLSVPQAMVVSPAAECNFTITKAYNPLPPSAGTGFTVTTLITNAGGVCNQANGVYFYDYQSHANITTTSNFTPTGLTQSPTAHFSLTEQNPVGMNQTTGYLNPWRVDVFQFAGSIPLGWTFQFDRTLTAVTAPTAPNSSDWPGALPFTYSCTFGAHQINFDIGAPSSANNAGGYDYKECAAAQVTTCVPMAQLPDLDAWWRFENNFNEQIFGNASTTGTSTTFVPGYVGQGMRSFRTVPDNPALDLGQGDFTIDAWVFVDTAPPANGAFNIFKKFATSTPAVGYELTIVSSGRVRFMMRDASGPAALVESQSSLVGQGWHFVAVSVRRDNPSGMTLYVRRGASAFGPAAIVTANPAQGVGNLDNSGPLYLGAVAVITDEAEIFDRALTIADLDALYNAHHSGKCGA